MTVPLQRTANSRDLHDVDSNADDHRRGFEWRESEGLRFLVAIALESAGARNGFSTRLDFTLPGLKDASNFAGAQAEPDSAEEDRRRRLLRAMGLPAARLVTLRQIHSDGIIPLSNGAELEVSPPEGDALFTRRRNIALGIRTADCAPILLFDPEHRIVAAVHSGWRGTVKGIVGKAVRAMSEAYGTQPGRILAALGPSIGPGCYEVGSEVIAAVGSMGAGHRSWLRPHPQADKAYFDLGSANTDQLLSAGLARENTFDCGWCTACRENLFFSYRRDRDRPEGHFRMISIIGLATGNDTHAEPRRR